MHTKLTLVVPLALVAATAGCTSDQDDAPAPEAAETQPEPQPESSPTAVQPEAAGAIEAGDPGEDADADADAPGGQSGMDLYRLAQAQMKAGKRQQGYETAKAAMRQFIADGDDLAWMMLESVEVGDKRIDVHFNMGPKERDPSIDGIVKPLSFRVWSVGEEPTLLRTLDYENGRFDGQVLTAAIGEQRGSVHGNLGMLELDATYEEIVRKVVEIVEGM